MPVHLAFEIYDDVAAYWFVLTLLAFVVVPRAIYLALSALYAPIRKSNNDKQHAAAASEGVPCSCEDCENKKKIIQNREQTQKRRKWLSFWNIVWLLTAVVFVWMLTGIEHKSGQKLATFNPYEILELPEAGRNDDGKPVSMSQIKASYRKLSLKWHPDKNPNDAEAAKQFILVSKAYQTLTDETTRENYEKYGNPDGYQGTSVTIGLPSFLSNKENEKVVLVVYAFVLFLIPLLALMWWRKAKNYDDSGVMHETMANFFALVTAESTVKSLIPALASSAEYRGIVGNTQPRTQEEVSDWTKLDKRLSDVLPKSDLDKHAWIFKTSRLLHAYLLREEVPKAFEPILNGVLEHTHKLIDTMVDMALMKQAIKPLLSAIELSQYMTQRLWVHESPLRQLPHLSEKEIGVCARKNVKNVQRFKQLTARDREKLLPKITKQQLTDIDAVSALLPEIEIDSTFEVEGEEEQQVYVGDMVTIAVQIKRVHSTAVANIIEEKDDQNMGMVGQGGKDDHGSGLAEESDGKATDLVARKQEKQVVEDDVEEDDPMALRWKGFDPNKPQFVDKPPAPLVHASQFPFPKREKWYVVLWDRTEKRIVGFQRLPSLQESEKVDLKVMPQEAGVHIYDLHVKCDSYLGCDRLESFKITVMKNDRDEKSDSKVARIRADGEEDGDDDDELLDEEKEEEEEEGKWYYLYCASFKELVLNAVLLTLLFVFLFNFLYSRGWFYTFGRWWVSYGQPVWDMSLGPVWNAVRGFLARYVYDFTSYTSKFVEDFFFTLPPMDVQPTRNRDL